MSLLNIFANNLLPILLLSGAGFLLGKTLHLDPRPLGRVIFYILSPILVFSLITSNALPIGKILTMMGYTVINMFVLAGLAFLIGKLLHLRRTVLIAVVLTTLFANGGNYGLPLVSFAFGESALAYASVYFVTSTVIFYTVGVLIASVGHMTFKQALQGLLKVPAIYATVLAILFVQTGWTLPGPLERTVTLAAGAAVPGMLIMLGLELTRVAPNGNLPALSIPTFCRLVLGPILGLATAALFGLQGPIRQAGVTECSTSSAVMTTVLATEYDLEPSLVTAIIFISTVLSPLTLTPVLYYLGR
jgi:malate permease and related proteins